MIRPIVAADMAGLKSIIDRNELFPSEMLDAIMATYLAGNEGEEVWLTQVDDGTPAALVYCAQERMTEGTWNMLLIAVDPSRHGTGIGGALTATVEAMLADRGARILLVETSGLPAFEATRGFYRSKGYREEARIHDFYQHGEDKIVFLKAIESRSEGDQPTGVMLT